FPNQDVMCQDLGALRVATSPSIHYDIAERKRLDAELRQGPYVGYELRRRMEPLAMRPVLSEAKVKRPLAISTASRLDVALDRKHVQCDGVHVLNLSDPPIDLCGLANLDEAAVDRLQEINPIHSRSHNRNHHCRVVVAHSASISASLPHSPTAIIA